VRFRVIARPHNPSDLPVLKDEPYIVRFPPKTPCDTYIVCGRLDTIGLAGFSHNFGALEGKHATVTEVFDIFGASPRSSASNKGLMLLAQTFPFLIRLPTPRTNLLQKLNIAMEEISNELIARTQREMEMGVIGGKEERSIIGLLSTWLIPNFQQDGFLISTTYLKIVKGASNDSEFHLTKEEVVAQVNELMPRKGPSLMLVL